MTQTVLLKCEEAFDQAIAEVTPRLKRWAAMTWWCIPFMKIKSNCWLY